MKHASGITSLPKYSESILIAITSDITSPPPQIRLALPTLVTLVTLVGSHSRMTCRFCSVDIRDTWAHLVGVGPAEPIIPQVLLRVAATDALG